MRETLTAEELGLIEGLLQSVAGNIKNNLKRYGWKALAAKVGRVRDDLRVPQRPPPSCDQCDSSWDRARWYASEADRHKERADRATAQIREALSILESGTECEQAHIESILRAGL